MIQIVAISGKRGSGKSLLARFLEQSGFETVSLADDLKRRCMKDFLLTSDQVYGHSKELPSNYKRTNGEPLTPRDVMIRMGVFYRSVDPLFWCKKAASMFPEHGKVVIDDIRFLNEIKFFKENYNTKLVRIERSQELNIYKAAMDDLSETELDNFQQWDFHLQADFNRVPADLKEFADTIVRRLELAF